MLYLFMGPSCSGKSSTAEELKIMIRAEVVSGKDYLRNAKNEGMAWKLFEERLMKAADSGSDQSVIYVLTDRSILHRLDGIANARKVRFSAELETLKARFGKRTGGVVPAPVEAMLKKQMMEWDDVPADLVVDTSNEKNPSDIAKEILNNSK